MKSLPKPERSQMMNKNLFQEALAQFVRREFRKWQGLSAGGTLTAVRHYFSNYTDDIGEAVLGQEFFHYLVVSVDGDTPPVRVWFAADSEQVVLLDAPYLELQHDLPSLLAALVDPAAKLDTDSVTLPVSTGEWVYSDRGLTLFLSETDVTVFHLAAFAATTLSYYKDHLRLSLRTRR
jgi:hypothetical protein